MKLCSLCFWVEPRIADTLDVTRHVSIAVVKIFVEKIAFALVEFRWEL